jgi:thiamine-monophosphate kinase
MISQNSKPADSAAPVSANSTGEFGLIADIQQRLVQGPDVLLGPGDDAAVVAAPDGRVVASTDVLADGVHFRRDWSAARDVGVRAAAANLADVVAMGARPTALLVGLAIPAHIDRPWILELAEGLAAEATRAGASVVGGDIVRSDQLVIAVTALGDLEGRDAVTRSGAQAGDVVAVCGRLGWAAAGLAVLSRGFRSPKVLVEAHRRPEPDYGSALAASGSAHAMCDVSDGLVADLGHVAAASGVQIDLDGDLLSHHVTPAMQDVAGALGGADPRDWVLGGGDDHAFAATFAADAVLPSGWLRIGQVMAGGSAVVEAGVTVDGVAPAVTGHAHAVP